MALGLTGCQQKANQADQDALLTNQTLTLESVDFKTSTVTKQDFTTETTMKGTVIYLNSTALSFPQKANFVQFVVEEGQQVKKGDLLAECEISNNDQKMTELELQINHLSLELDTLTADYQQDMKQLTNGKNKSSGNENQLYSLLLTQKQKQYDYKSSQINNKLSALISEKKKQEDTQEQCNIYAKSDGVIDKLGYVTAGEEVDTDRWMVKMHDESVSYIQVSDDKGNLDYNMAVSVQADNGGRQTYTGKVVCADTILSEALKTGYAYIRLDDEDVNLADLKNIVVTVTLQKLEDVLVVDRTAVNTAQGKKYVLVYEDGVIKKRYVTIGLEGKDVIYLLNGVKEGQKVIIES